MSGILSHEMPISLPLVAGLVNVNGKTGDRLDRPFPLCPVTSQHPLSLLTFSAHVTLQRRQSALPGFNSHISPPQSSRRALPDLNDETWSTLNSNLPQQEKNRPSFKKINNKKKGNEFKPN